MNSEPTIIHSQSISIPAAASFVNAQTYELMVCELMAGEMERPLTAIKGYATHLIEGLASVDRTQHILHTIIEQAELTQQLVDEFVAFHQLTQQEATPAAVSTSVQTAVVETVKSFEMAAEAKQLQWVINSLPLDAFVALEKRPFVKLLSNLLDNAIRYTPSGGLVQIQAYIKRGSCILKVSDTGPGISDELLEAIFQPNRAGGHSAAGYGMGLYVARVLIESAGGHITVDTFPTRGTVFTVELPLAEPTLNH